MLVTTHEYVTETLETVLHEFVHEKESPHVSDPVTINGGHCRWFADCVMKRLGSPADVVRHDAWDIHTWIELDGRHYDAETVEGVENPHTLPIWERLTDERLEMAAESSSVLSLSGFRQQASTDT